MVELIEKPTFDIKGLTERQKFLIEIACEYTQEREHLDEEDYEGYEELIKIFSKKA